MDCMDTSYYNQKPNVLNSTILSWVIKIVLILLFADSFSSPIFTLY